jgi:hypothetical protein
MSADVHSTCRARISAHFEGRVHSSAERAMRLHLEDCEVCRRHYARYWTLAALDPHALAAQQRLGRGLGLRERRWGLLGGSTSPLRAWLLAAASVAGLALLLLRRSPSAPEFTARGMGPGTPVTVEVYHASPGRPLALADRILRASDELAFAYSNRGQYPYLTVCGIDEHQHVYWYHPAWTSAEQDPRSIPIQRSGRVEELPEAISQALDGRRLRLISVFSRAPLRVRELERTLLALASSGPSLQIVLEERYGDVRVADRMFEVTP